MAELVNAIYGAWLPLGFILGFLMLWAIFNWMER